MFCLYIFYCIVRAVVAVRLKHDNWRNVHSFHMISAINAIIIAGAGVVGRYYIFPGNPEYGFIVSIIVAIPTVLFSLKQKHKLMQ